MTQKRLVSLSVVVALGLLSPLSVWAFGLGKITVNSALNQPFEAEIPVSSLRATERGNLDVRLASLSDFDRAGLERSLLLTQLRFEVIEQGSTALVKITSQVPIKEPFLDFLVTASAGEGRMLREYTVLLDPPAAVFNRPSQPSSAPIRTAPQATSAPASRPSVPADRYQVRSGDTLWQIAQQIKPASDITSQQMMMALLAANPNAFQRNNINGLKADVSLRIPDANTIRQLSAAQANTAVNEQTAQWRNRRPAAVNNVAATLESVEAADTIETVEAVSPDSNQATAEVSNDSAEPTNTSENTDNQQLPEDASRLQLVAAADDGDAEADPSQLGDPAVEKLNQQLTLAQETIEAQNQENIDFKQRMDAMEEQLETMRRLLSLKDEDMARLQSMLEDGSQTTVDAQPLVSLNTENETSPAAQDNNVGAADVMTEVADETANVPTDKPAAANYLDTGKAFVSNYLMELLLGFLLLLLLMWLVIRHRRQEQTWEEAIGEVSTDDESLKQADIDDATNNAMVAPEVTEFVGSTNQPEKTVDELVEQADMFVGYADYVQARTALEQAHQIAPENKAVAAKLLFVLFKQNKATEFNTVLADSNINKNDGQWPDVRGWGLALMPNDGRFKAEPADITEPTVESALDPEPTTTDSAASYDEAASSIDFDVSQYQSDDVMTTNESSAESPETDTDDLSTVDFEDSRRSQVNDNVASDDLAPIHLDLDDNDLTDWQKPADEQPTLDDSVQPISLDIDDDDVTASEVDSEAEKIAMQELDVGDAQDDLDFDFSGYDEVDEAETKLDLAAAYVDMEDPDGARSILQEVVNEGTEEQKQRAQVLLDSLT